MEAKTLRPHWIRIAVDSRAKPKDNPNVSFTNLRWLFPVVIILHNVEEAIWLPGWARRSGFWCTPVSTGVFCFAVAVLTVLALAVTWLSARSGGQTLWTYLTFGYMVAMLANAVYPHVVISIAARSYMPGTATAVALNLPALSFLMASALAERQVTGWKAVAYGAGVPGLLLLSLPALFKFGRALNL
ncbi:HXXEE domain-containing protein [Paludibaculum fermentans]|uniref:HXXEE domain-containing protein n=1 Tax=Paludibaculum fermentans TaxID=1473598 RepID=UPI003EBD429D